MNNILTASELAKVLVDTIVSKYLETGLVVSDNYVPNTAKVQTKATRAEAIVPPKVINRVTVPTNTAKVHPNVESAFTTDIPERPKFGDFQVWVGQSKDGSRVSRAKLPADMFRSDDGTLEFEAIVVTLSNGEQVLVNRDAEGRGRLGKAELDSINCGPNSYLVFTLVYDGLYEVAIVANEYVSFGPVASKVQTEQPKQARGYWGAMPSANQDVPKVKKPRSAAQLANDARLRDRAINRNGNAAQTRNTPNYVKVQPSAKQVRVERNRANNHATQYANNTAHRNTVSTLRNVVAPIVKR